MNLIEKEKKFLLEIAHKDFVQNSLKNYLSSNRNIDETHSYYINRDEDEYPTYLTEYDFQVPMELKSILEKQWTDFSERKMIPAIIIAAFKLQNYDTTIDQISEKIYNF